MNLQNNILLCAICTVSSGACNEDCAFCAQSVKYKTNAPVFKLKETKDVVLEAKAAKAAGAVGFCLVTSGVRLDDKKVEYIAKTASAIKKEVNDLFIIACNGLADKESLKELKAAGVSSYNHNLETAKSYYDKICTTHTWDERYQTCEAVKAADLMLCSGGIFGIGESVLQRGEFLLELASLKPQSVPLNFYHPNAALPINSTPMDVDTALNIIKSAKIALKDSLLMAAGGRELTFGDRQKEIFDLGIDAIVVGDYLTTKGEGRDKTLELLQAAGKQPLSVCLFH